MCFRKIKRNKAANTTDILADYTIACQSVLKESYSQFESIRRQLNEQSKLVLAECVRQYDQTLMLTDRSSANQSTIDSIRAYRAKLLQALQEFGIEQYMPKRGDVFDPYWHKCINNLPQGQAVIKGCHFVGFFYKTYESAENKQAPLLRAEVEL